MTDVDASPGPWRACSGEPLTLAYLAGDVVGAERELAEEHLADCDACRQTAVFYARLLAEETPEETLLLEMLARRTELDARAHIRGDDAASRAVVPEAMRPAAMRPEAIRPEAPRADVWRWVVWVMLAAAVAAAIAAAMLRT